MPAAAMFSHIQHEVAQVMRKSNSSELLAFEWSFS
jgi:hypothetical protein